MSKRKIPPFKMIPVVMREHLHEFTGSELKLWLYLYLRSDKTQDAFPSNDLIMAETGLSHNTLAEAKKGLRAKGFTCSTQRYRENGSLSTMNESVCIPKNWGYISPEVGGIPPQEVGIGYPQKLGIPEVDTLAVAASPHTEKPDTSKPEDLSERASEGKSRSSSTPSTSTTLSTSNSHTDSSKGFDSGVKAETEQEQNQEQDQPWHEHCQILSGVWLKRTGKPFTPAEYTLATKLIAKEGYKVVEAVLDITLNHREKSAKMMWRRFKVFADNWDTNFALAKSWHAVKVAKKEYPREIPSKFSLKKIAEADWDVMLASFRSDCKVGDWTFDREQYGITLDQMVAAVRFCVENGVRVTLPQYIDLVYEAVVLVSFESEPELKAVAAGFDLNDIEHVGKGFDLEEA